MAVDAKANPFVFATQDDKYEPATFVKTIIIESGASGGTFEMKDYAKSRSLTGSLVLPANDMVQILIDGRVEGLWCTALPDGQMLVYTEE